MYIFQYYLSMTHAHYAYPPWFNQALAPPEQLPAPARRRVRALRRAPRPRARPGRACAWCARSGGNGTGGWVELLEGFPSSTCARCAWLTGLIFGNRWDTDTDIIHIIYIYTYHIYCRAWHIGDATRAVVVAITPAAAAGVVGCCCCCWCWC